MTENGRIRRSRRQLLAGGAAAAGVVAASLARGGPAQAANGDALILGRLNQASSDTTINATGGNATISVGAPSGGIAVRAGSVDGTAVEAFSTSGWAIIGGLSSTAANAAAVTGQINIGSPGPYSAGIRGINDGTGSDGIGVYGSHAGSGTGVYGTSPSGNGVYGTSATGAGVTGTSASTSADAAAVYGELTSGSPGPSSAAVRGKNDGTGSDGIGVYGSHAGGGWGVYGTSLSGLGVYGTSESDVGVAGFGTTGVSGSGTTGVHGTATSGAGAGVLAENDYGGPALKVKGAAEFSRSGVATVAPGQSQVSHGVPLTSASFVLATIQGNVTDLYVRGVTITAGSPGSFTIHLSKAVATKTKVAWLVIN